MGQITSLWQMLLSAYEDVRRAPDPLAGAEMAILRMTVAATLPAPELASQLLEGLKHVDTAPAGEASVTSEPTPAPSQRSMSTAPVPETPVSSQTVSSQTVASRGGAHMQALQTDPQPALLPEEKPLVRGGIDIDTLEKLVTGMPKSQTRLKYDIRQYVRPILFERGKIIFEPAPGAPRDLAPRLAQYVQDITGQTWMVSPDTATKGEPSLTEQQKHAAQQQAQYENAHPVVAKAKELFAGVEIEFRDRLLISDKATSNVIKANFPQHEDRK
jgi:DNA polymerase-3 subunit gamma/tau